MLLALDELANVCRWPELPDLYSHYGSRGISVMAIFQSWSQMVELYGLESAKKMWGASTVKVIGSGLTDTDFLETISKLIGDYEAPQVSKSTGRQGGPTYSQSRQRDRIMDISDLASLPKGRAIVLAAGARPALCRTRPWMAGNKSAHIRASIARFDPDGVSEQLALTAPAGPDEKLPL